MITAYAQKLSREIVNYTSITALPNIFWQESYEVFKKIPELTGSLKLNSIDPLTAWIEGKDYKEIADLYFDGKTEIVVTKLEKVTYAFAWGFNSLIRHLGFYLKNEKVPVIFNNLTSFVTNGVPNTAAVFAISLGVYDRQTAIALSRAYQSSHPETEYSTFKEWLFNLDFEQWIAVLEVCGVSSHEIEECFKKVQQKQQTLQENPTVFDCSLVQTSKSPRLDDSIEQDQLIIVNFDGHIWLTTYDY